MPPTQPKRDNPLMRRYFRRLGLTEWTLAQGAGVAPSKAHFALRGSLNARNAGRVAAFITEQLDLSERERLELKAEVMGRPNNLTYAHFGTIDKAMRDLYVSRHTAIEVLRPGAEINGNAAEAIRQALEASPTPPFVAEDVLSRIGPAKGRVTYRVGGLDGRNVRARTRRSLLWGKPATHEALADSGLFL